MNVRRYQNQSDTNVNMGKMVKIYCSTHANVDVLFAKHFLYTLSDPGPAISRIQVADVDCNKTRENWTLLEQGLPKWCSLKSITLNVNTDVIASCFPERRIFFSVEHFYCERNHRKVTTFNHPIAREKSQESHKKFVQLFTSGASLTQLVFLHPRRRKWKFLPMLESAVTARFSESLT